VTKLLSYSQVKLWIFKYTCTCYKTRFPDPVTYMHTYLCRVCEHAVIILYCTCCVFRFMIDALLTEVHNTGQFKKLLQIFYADKNYFEVAESIMTVYCVFKNEEIIIETLNFKDLMVCLKQKGFFTKEEERTLPERQNNVIDILEMLKDKELDYFKVFLSSLRELKQDGLITLDESYPSYSVHNFQCSLRKQYTSHSFMMTSHIDYYLPISDDINIALIEVSEEDHKEQSTFFDYHSLLLKHKTNYIRKFLYSYSDIVVENCRVVLIQGYPGSGKTFLAKRMCTKWAKGELLQQFVCVVFLQLRDKEVASANSLKQLVELHIGTLTKMTVNEIEERQGKGLLIILEGWDELPETRQGSSIFTRLISGVLLPEAVIVITSRPSALRSLDYNHIQRRIEILGFTEQQVMQNITHYFHGCNNGSELMTKFCSELERLPLLKCFVFVPINLNISLYIFNKCGYRLPETFTGMYKNLVLIQLQRYQTRTSYGSSSISDLDSLPPEIDGMLLRLSKLAYDSMQNNITLIFDEVKIKHYCFDSNNQCLDNFDGMGLLQVTNHRHFESFSKTYQFIHRTLQELLAAWYLSRQDKLFQQKQLKSIFNKKEFEMVWIFYAGITKFASVSFKDFLPDNYILKIKMSIYRVFGWYLRTLVRNIIIRFPDVSEITENFYYGKQYFHNLSNCISTEFQTTLIAAVMEAQNPQLCKDMCNSYLFYDEPFWFSVPESASTPQILSALSYCIAHSGKKWMIQCKIFDRHMAVNFLKHLTSPNRESKTSDHCDDSRICLFDVDCSQNEISGIPRIIHSQKCLQWLLLSYSKQAGDQLIIEVAEALKENTCLKMLHLVGCNITSNGIEAIADMLKVNETLMWIGLKDNMATLKEEDILTLLRVVQDHNDTVVMIFLDNMLHSSKKVQVRLNIINQERQLKGKQKLNLSLLGCFKRNEICQRIISRIPFIKKDMVSLYCFDLFCTCLTITNTVKVP